MTDDAAAAFLSSLRVTALSQRNQRAADAIDRALVALRGDATCSCGHAKNRHLACEVKICGCQSFIALERKPLAGNQGATSGIASTAASPALKANSQLTSDSAQGTQEIERQWQPIETFDAEKNCSVLIAGPDGVGEAEYRGDEGWWWMNNYPSDSWGNRLAWPTHWMPLPDPPTDRALATLKGEE